MMQKKKRRDVVVILRSCLTGVVVWIYMGPNKEAMRKAYQRACKAEIEYVRNWPKVVAERRANIARFINDCTANLPLTGELTQKQKDALKRLHAMEKQEMPCYMEFYNHIMEMRRRCAKDTRYRRQVHLPVLNVKSR